MLCKFHGTVWKSSSNVLLYLLPLMRCFILLYLMIFNFRIVQLGNLIMFLRVLFLFGNVDIWVVCSKWSLRSRDSLWSCHGQIVWGTGLQSVSKWYLVWHWNIRFDRCSLTTRYVIYRSSMLLYFARGVWAKCTLLEGKVSVEIKVVRRGGSISRSKSSTEGVVSVEVKVVRRGKYQQK